MDDALKVGAYVVERRLGRGGMAETYVGIRHDPSGFEQRVCVKRVLPSFASDPVFLRAFREEARVSAGLRHHNIVQTLDFGSHDDSFLALELIDGCNLRELIAFLKKERQQLPASLLAFLAHEVGNALAYAHNAGVTHRDISPANILLSKAGEVKLGDFGIAIALGKTRFTSEGLVKGKLPYMAPEYARDGHADGRTDLFSLGATLYEAALGQRPYRSKNSLALLQETLSGNFAPIPESVAPTVLSALIGRCLTPARDQRPADARAFLSALETFPPPPTARRILASFVQAAVDRNKSALPAAQAAQDATMALTATPRPADQVFDAPIDAPTRTRLAAQAGNVSTNEVTVPDTAEAKAPTNRVTKTSIVAVVLVAFLIAVALTMVRS